MAAKLGGTTGGKYGLGQNADINVTPFVDVMLVLLIIFMVSIPAATVAIKIDLPPATPDESTMHKKPIYINIHKDSINIVDTPTTLASMIGALDAGLGVADPKKETILIRADHDVRYEDFMSVVNKLQSEGYYKVALILEEV